MIGALAFAFGFDATGAAGLLAGIQTNTPLAGLLDAIQGRGAIQRRLCETAPWLDIQFSTRWA